MQGKTPTDDTSNPTSSTTAITADVPKKLTPIVVKESKIISLKKKPSADSTSLTVPNTATTSEYKAPHKHIPTAKIIPETKKDVTTTAVVRPQIKKQTVLDGPEFDDIDEDALLADSPSPPHTPPVSLLHHIHNHDNNVVGNKKRRVVLKHPVDSTNLNLDKDLVTTTGEKASSEVITKPVKTKGIFDRLEKKITVNETSKRTIQRIVINNTD